MFNQQPEPPYGRIEMQMCTLLLGLLYVSEPVWVVSRFVVCICLRQSPPLNQMQQPIKQWQWITLRILSSSRRYGGSRSPNVFDALWNLKPSFFRIVNKKENRLFIT